MTGDPATAAAVHTPVMLTRVVELLGPALGEPGSVLVDGTLGMAGHAAALLTACPGARLIGIDRDAQALDTASARLAAFERRTILARARFDSMAEVLDGLGIGQVNAILLDLGVSSLQIDRPERGFAYSQDAPLDMRMDQQQQLDATDVVNRYSAADLARLFRDYGEERHAWRIAEAIVEQRQTRRLTRTGELVAVVMAAIPAAARYGGGGHPAKRVFQALRIEVNAELRALAAVLPLGLDRLAPGGRFAVLSYHSLEDRLVKRAFAEAITDQAPAGLPVVPDGMRARAVRLTKGAERPDEAEVEQNPRAASARLRAVQMISEVGR